MKTTYFKDKAGRINWTTDVYGNPYIINKNGSWYETHHENEKKKSTTTPAPKPKKKSKTIPKLSDGEFEDLMRKLL